MSSKEGSNGVASTSGHRILILEDDSKMREALKYIMIKEGYTVETAASGEVALRRIRSNDYDLIISDIKLPGIDGLEVLASVKKYRPDISVILITAYATIDSAVRAMKEGAEDYVTKPFEMDEICIVVRKVVEKRILVANNAILKESLKKKYRFDNLIGNSESMINMFKVIHKVKDSISTVLILGETGTGKEQVARAIHFNSIRSDQLFLPVNCAAVTENLLQSELFGYMKGSFTGAVKDKRGIFDVAEGGTVFLDEIGDISTGFQQVLLRVLEDGEIQPLGSTERKKVRVRVIAATSKDLEELVVQGIFREDLFFRLDVISIHLPPLRDRREDIALLAAHFIDRHRVDGNDSIRGISREAMTFLENYSWPGNVRELDNVIERAILLGSGSEISIESLPRKILDFVNEEEATDRRDDERTLEEVSKAYIIDVLRKTRGSKSKAAEILGINRTTLWRMMRKLGIVEDDAKQ